MNIRFTAKQLEITPDIRSYCEKRLKTMARLLRPPVEVDIVLSMQKYRYKAEANLKAKGLVAVAEEVSPDLMTTLGQMLDSLEKRVKREREKVRQKKRRLSRETRLTALAEMAEREAGEKGKKIIRTDDYSLKPMSVDEALLQLELKRKEVFVFRREGDEKFAVVFKRRDGNYGLIEPEE